MRRLIPLTGVLSALLSAPAEAINVADARYYYCVRGSCTNGEGTVKELYSDVLISGRWSNGQSVAGERYLTSPNIQPDKVFEQYYGSDGLLERGTQLRVIAAGRLIPRFTGTFGRLEHPFYRRTMAVPLEGVYNTGTDIEYRGRFEYIPLKGHEAGVDPVGTGNFIFYGDKVDLEDGEKSSGLFVGLAVSGSKIMLQPARADYLSVLQAQYRRDLELAEADFRKQESEAMFRAALSVIAEVALVMAGGGGYSGSSGSARFALELVNDLITSSQRGEADAGAVLVDVVSRALFKKIGGGKASSLNQKLGDAVSRGLQKAREAEAARLAQ